jgi:superfamily I DNA and/or RNA helicase
MLSLPIRGDHSNFPGYFSALTCPSNCQRFLSESEQSRYHQSGRFDVRFGLFGQKAHEIFRQTLAGAQPEQVVRITAPTLLLSGIQLKSNRRLQIGISEWANPDINMEQRHAVYDIVRKNHGSAPYIINGPAGTGKTMTVVESIVQVLRWNAESKILVCAPSDAACDVLAVRLLSVLPKASKLLRVNYNCRNPDSLPPSLLSVSTMNESGLFTLPTFTEMANSSIIVCQCFVAGLLDSNSLNYFDWMRNHFTHVFIDESSQSFEFESMIPLLKVGLDCSVILAGDPKQLGPTVRSQIASRNGLSLSLQERLMGLKLYSIHGALKQSYAVITTLLDNYRSHDALLRIPSELFYAGSLRCKASNEKTSACQNFELLRDGERFPLLVYDVVDGKEMSKIDTPSFYNIEECETISRIIQALLSSPNVQLHSGDVAVITCFRAQVLKLREVLRKDGLSGINVGVVEDFQGQEKSVVLISTVLTNSNNRWRSDSGGLGFMTDPKKFNVAITRASSFCAIVGKVDYLEQSGSYWSALIEHIRKNGGISRSDVRIHSSKLDQGDVYTDYEDYGISEFIKHIENLNLLGSGHEMDRYDLAMRGYYEDAPEWKVCL